MDDIICYWLIPEKEDCAYFRDIIARLASKYGAAVFDPHITVYVTDNYSEASVVDAIDRMAKQASPVSLDVNTLEYTQDFTQSLFLSLMPSEELDAIRGCCDVHLTSTFSWEFKPHLSLLYANISLEEKRRLSQSLAIEKSEIIFDKIQVVKAPIVNQCKQDVESWVTVATKQLAM